ncbi:MAG TPA: DUF1707 domain-containing protein [Solirubrobacteraceae bacterium]
MDVRASDAERERAVERLRAAAVEGRLTLEELADRSEAANRAVMRAELEQLVADLPAPLPAAPAQAKPVRAIGDVKRSGAWLVPAESHYRSWLGNVQLDLREARIGAADVRIDVRTLFGVIDLLVPEGVEVDVRARTRMGRIRQEHSEPAALGAPRIVLTGGSVFGEIRVRHRRLWEKLVRRLGER